MDKEYEARERLAAIEEIESRITDILLRSEAVVSALAAGKAGRMSLDDAKAAFSKALKEFNEVVVSVDESLHSEIQRLQKALKTSVLPLNLPRMANAFSTYKEKEIWETMQKSLSVDGDVDME